MLTTNSIGLAHHARVFPEKTALVIATQSVSYDRLNRRVNRLSRALRRAGIAQRDTVAAVLGNCIEWFELLNACGKIGARLVPIGYRLKGPEIAYMAHDSQALVMLAATDLRGEVDRALEELGWSDDKLWVIGRENPWRGRAFEDVLAAESDDEPDDAFVGGGFNALVYTSGTTGRPKGVERDVAAKEAHLQLFGLAQMWGSDCTDVHLVCGPLYHTAPSSYGQVHLLAGATVVVLPHFDAAECLHSIERYKVTTTFMVPTHFARILHLDDTERRAYDLSSLRLVLHSAAPCPAQIKRDILKVFPPHTITEFYGASESGFTKITAEEWLAKPGSVGRPWPGHELRIFDDNGRECATGEIGLIYVKSPSLGFRYRGADDISRTAFRDGFFTAGDLGYIDNDGYLYLADRRTDLIISGGANIYPAEVEGVLMQHSAVADVAVVGLPDDDMGKTVLAVVELRPGYAATPGDLIAFSRDNLAHYKCPRRIELVDTLPREPSGKVRKHELIRRYVATDRQKPAE